MTVVYVAGPYRAPSKLGILRNIYRAWRVSRDLWRKGFVVLCPHSNTFWMSEWPNKIAPEVFLDGDLALLSRCDVVLMLEGWQNSEGAIRERDYARKHHIPVVYSVDSLEKGKDLWPIRRY
jgi:nucleoside 2-deoxyribosyltransferase